MADAGLDVVGDRGACLDANCSCSLVTGGKLVAGHRGRGHVSDWPVTLIVCCLADVGPVGLEKGSCQSVIL